MNKYMTRMIAIVVMAVLAPLTVVAQDDGSGYRQVRTMTVKSGSLPDFLALQAQFAKAAKAAGMSRDFWQEVRGNSATFHAVTSIDSLAELDDGFEPPMEQDKWQAWISKFGNSVASSTFINLRTDPGHGIPAAEGTEPNLMLLRYRTVKPGMGGEYSAWIKNDLIPAIKEGGFKGFRYSRVQFGDNPNTWISATQHANWASLGGPNFFSHMSQEEVGALLGKSNDMVVDSDIKILQYRADLSY